MTFYSSHFVRIFCTTFKDKRKISKFFENYGYIIHCNNCGYRTTIKNSILDAPQACPECKNQDKIDYAGPLWIGEIHNEEFIKELLIFCEQSHFKNRKRINKLLSLIQEELKMPTSYYNTHKLCQILKISMIPKLEILINKIKEKGYKCSRTHFDYLSFKSNLDIEGIKECLLEIQKEGI